MRFDSSITTTCGYCGVGCRLEAHAVNGGLLRDGAPHARRDRHQQHRQMLVGSSMDVNTSCPEYKVIAVDVRPMPEEATMTPALA